MSEDKDKKSEPESKEIEMEPGDDTKEAQPSIEREDAATGSTGSSFGSGAGESGGIGSQGN